MNPAHYPPRRSFAPLPIGRKMLVIPPTLQIDPKPDQILLRIDPGTAFGDGAHPTTQLCLAAIERHLPRVIQSQKPTAEGAWAMIDLGAGTGILSIAAAKLGAEPILAVDIDADSVEVARANAALNQVGDQLRAEQGSLADVLAGRFGKTQAPLVVANILAHVLVDFFAQGLAETVTPGGLLLLSGILRTQGPEIRARLAWAGLTLAGEERQEEWLCLIARRPGPPAPNAGGVRR